MGKPLAFPIILFFGTVGVERGNRLLQRVLGFLQRVLVYKELGGKLIGNRSDAGGCLFCLQSCLSRDGICLAVNLAGALLGKTLGALCAAIGLQLLLSGRRDSFLGELCFQLSAALQCLFQLAFFWLPK